MSRVWVMWLLAGTLVLGLVASVDGQETPKSGVPNTPDELTPGLPLDGSVIIDESFWLRLVGEPGRLMRDAHEQFGNKDWVESAESVRNVASFLHIAAGNATKLAKERLKHSADELDQLSRRISDESVRSIKVLESAFARAHYAMARHHVLKATEALDKKQFKLAGGYLGSATDHFQRAAAWSNRPLKPESVAVIKANKSLVSRLLAGKSPTDEAGQMIKNLRERIKVIGKYIEPAKPVVPPTTPNKSDDESMP